jgi:hypothetical protein
MSYFETILDLETGEQTIRQYTQAEIDEAEKIKALRATEQAVRDAETQAKAQAKTTLLAKLGITEEEATLLLGGN